MGAPAVLWMWTIYESPADWPGAFVMRRFGIGVEPGEPRPDPDCLVAVEIEHLRERCRRMGLVCIPRSPQDPPAIVETWF